MDASKKFVLDPYIGTDLVKFGMSIDEVAHLLGPADHVSKNHLGQRVEFRAAMNVGYSSTKGTVSHIGFGRQMQEVYFAGLNLFLSDPMVVLKALASADPKPMVYMGFVVFLGLGLALTGFHDQDESQKAVSLFEKGAWDKRIGKLVPFALPT